MPRINTGSTSSSESTDGLLSLLLNPKVLGLIALIGAGGWYLWYQYERLHPAPKRPAAAARQASAKPAEKQTALAEKLGLTSEQKEKLAAATAGTTSPQAMRRELNKLLTPEQKARATTLRKEERAKIEERKKARQERQEKYYPGEQKAVADAASKAARARAQARKQQAAQAAQPQ